VCWTDLKAWTACNHLDELTSTRLRQVRETGRLIANIVGRDDGKYRRKRGLFDFVVKVNKVLFGTPDGEDGQYCNEQTVHFEKNSNRLAHLLRQLTIVRPILGAVNDTLADTTHNEEKMRDGLTRL
jgi:hypothetical protein